jgi:hypothetical protein
MCSQKYREKSNTENVYFYEDMPDGGQIAETLETGARWVKKNSMKYILILLPFRFVVSLNPTGVI